MADPARRTPVFSTSVSALGDRRRALLLRWQQLPETGRWIALAVGGAVALGGSIAVIVTSARPEAAEPLRPAVLREALADLPSAADDPAVAAAPSEVAGEMPSRVMEALRERTIRALDILLVGPESSAAMTFAAAEAHCRELRLEELTNWRLPEIGELGSLTRAAMLGPHRYWSQTPADTFGDERIVWWAKRQRTVPAVEAAHVVCVRASNAP